MAVVINDFEVIHREENPKSAAKPAQGGSASGQGASLSLSELGRVERHGRERALRLWAH
jgi:hypothetical protein